MEYAKNKRKQFYQNLGKLFYSIAIADKKVHATEVKKLREAVDKQWLDVDKVTDEFGTDAAYQIEIIFDWLLEQEEKESDTYFEEFRSYYKENTSEFTDSIKGLIWKTADGIAASFSGKNKSELVLLAKLKSLLQ